MYGIITSLFLLMYSAHADVKENIVFNVGVQNSTDIIHVKEKAHAIDVKKSISESMLKFGVGYAWNSDYYIIETGLNYHTVKPLVYLNNNHHFSYKRSPILGYYTIVGMKMKDFLLYGRINLTLSHKTLKVNTPRIRGTIKHKRKNQLDKIFIVGVSKKLQDNLFVFVEYALPLDLHDKDNFSGLSGYDMTRSSKHSHIHMGVGYKI